MRAVHFGAGNIGRGFIGLLLSRSGYTICFVDVNDKVVSLLRQRGSYTVSLATESHDSVEVNGVSAINGNEVAQVIQQIASADLITTAVGVNLLGSIADVIARGIEHRIKNSLSGPLQVIACENAIHASSLLKKQVYERLSREACSKADEAVFFTNTAVDRIVPIQSHDDPLEVTVEPFYEWLIDRRGMPPGAVQIQGAGYVDQLESYIERKLFTVNTGHCCAAYLGYLNGYATIHETMADPAISIQVRQVLEETGSLLVKKHGLNLQEHTQYIQKIMSRFGNAYLSDGVVRVGRSPIRKLSPNDRLVRPALQAFHLGIEPYHLSRVIATALLFDYSSDEEAVQIQAKIKAVGIHQAAAHFTGIPIGHPVHDLIIHHYETLTQPI
ncbi:mannitol-1-phosphate 5-dehydrogenase [Paenibacillus sp. FSL H7-0331]|uniref:mannitol-1-phosphate 5-dehydrogenase n=1 Tax=Paenibacillus sp. FSL H7-0331 TaxID=1920421 RepID=UPI00096C1B45|nr:mannitol-1-phosphate 5-dehydrogenase [Paenibacillus sp. FSL H7-0331]OMF19357.1 mannitol-1-phosphate 5-dehydrogenase [Paenibacillus sp. FSL H7-0331]